jgi:sugar/nucleoside kinase (ribokinase family)
MADTQFDVLTIGNAIVDVIAPIDPGFLAREGLTEGIMHLVDAERSAYLYDRMPADKRQVPGGSSANTAAGVASFGGRAAFIGKVADDTLGKVYRHDMHALGIHFETAPLRDNDPTARSMILITPDGERTMNTYLGACQMLTPADIDPGMVQAAAITYLEGYLWDPPQAKEAFRRAAEIAHAAGRKVSLTLSDAFCVDRFRAEFLGLIRGGTIDILFANDLELKSLYTTSSLDAAVAAVQRDCRLTAVTVGAEGALVVTAAAVEAVPATPVAEVVDLTGAGDLFASGFLYGVARGMALADAARLGTIAAAEVIAHIGPRPAVSLASVVADAGFGAA